MHLVSVSDQKERKGYWSISVSLGSIFEESDQAQAIRAFQMIDPTFNMDKFMVDARTYIVPELMEAYLKGDVDTLKLWCSEAVRYLVCNLVTNNLLYIDIQCINSCDPSSSTTRIN